MARPERKGPARAIGGRLASADLPAEQDTGLNKDFDTGASMPLHRIYFDTNAGDGLRYDLGLRGSLEDIAPISDQLQEGMRVIIYMTGELEMEATLEFDQKYGHWMARPIEGTMKIYPEAYGSNSVEALLETIERSLSKEMTKFDLFVPSDLTLRDKPVSADVAMAVILDRLLGTGFEPAGFSQAAHGRLYHYRRS